MENIYKKLYDIQKLKLSFEKDGINPHFKSKFITLDSIVDKLTPILEKRSLLLFHHAENREVVTKLVDMDSQEFVESRFPLVEVNDPQKLGSCITYAKRYNLGQIFNIITDRDDDGESYYDREEKKEATEAQMNAFIKNFEDASSPSKLKKVVDGIALYNWSEQQKTKLNEAFKSAQSRLQPNQ